MAVLWNRDIGTYLTSLFSSPLFLFLLPPCIVLTLEVQGLGELNPRPWSSSALTLPLSLRAAILSSLNSSLKLPMHPLCPAPPSLQIGSESSPKSVWPHITSTNTSRVESSSSKHSFYHQTHFPDDVQGALSSLMESGLLTYFYIPESPAFRYHFSCLFSMETSRAPRGMGGRQDIVASPHCVTSTLSMVMHINVYLHPIFLT